MMKRLFVLLALCAATVFSCEDEPALGENALLYEAWTHAFEEQDDVNSNTMVFRVSASQTFAPSRFRASYEFKADGSCEYLFLDPADAHHFKNGSFEYNQLDQILVIFDEGGAIVSRFEVQEISSDKLVMNRN